MRAQSRSVATGSPPPGCAQTVRARGGLWELGCQQSPASAGVEGERSEDEPASTLSPWGRSWG